MKKLLALSLLLGSLAFGVSAANAETTAGISANAPQVRIQIGRGNRRVRRVVVRTRTVYVGRRIYRETYRTTYFGNGRVRTQLIRRVRVR